VSARAESIHKTYRHKLKPAPEHERALEAVLWRCRVLYNMTLEQRNTWWERGQSRWANDCQQKAALPDLKVACLERAEIDAHVLQDVLLRVERTDQAFCRRVAADVTPGYPRFQPRGRYHAFTCPQVGDHGGARLDNSFIVLSRVGRIAVRWSRPPGGIPKTVAISREADGWYMSFSCAEVPTQPLPLTGSETWIDIGLKVLLITAEGAAVEDPRHNHRAAKLLSRRKKRSMRWWKAARPLGRTHQKAKHQRQDFQHKVALALVPAYDTLHLEDLQAASLVRNHHLANSMSDAGGCQFRTTLAYKAACALKRVVSVEPAFVTQDCSARRGRVPTLLAVRAHSVPPAGSSRTATTLSR